MTIKFKSNQVAVDRLPVWYLPTGFRGGVKRSERKQHHSPIDWLIFCCYIYFQLLHVWVLLRRDTFCTFSHLLFSLPLTLYLLSPTAKGMYVGAPCEFTCHAKLHHVYCDPSSNTCSCEKDYVVLIGLLKGCAKRKFAQACRHIYLCCFAWKHHRCATVGWPPVAGATPSCI